MNATAKAASQNEVKVAAKTGYRVVYGESRPAWEQIFPTMRAAKAFAKKHQSFGDVIFSIKKVVPGEAPQSMVGAIALAKAEGR